jgi:hypothetical protein
MTVTMGEAPDVHGSGGGGDMVVMLLRDAIATQTHGVPDHDREIDPECDMGGARSACTSHHGPRAADYTWWLDSPLLDCLCLGECSDVHSFHIYQLAMTEAQLENYTALLSDIKRKTTTTHGSNHDDHDDCALSKCAADVMNMLNDPVATGSDDHDDDHEDDYNDDDSHDVGQRASMSKGRPGLTRAQAYCQHECMYAELVRLSAGGTHGGCSGLAGFISARRARAKEGAGGMRGAPRAYLERARSHTLAVERRKLEAEAVRVSLQTGTPIVLPTPSKRDKGENKHVLKPLGSPRRGNVWDDADVFACQAMSGGPSVPPHHRLSLRHIELLTHMTLVAGCLCRAHPGAQSAARRHAQCLTLFPLLVVRSVQLLLWHRHPLLPVSTRRAAHKALAVVHACRWTRLPHVGRLILQMALEGARGDVNPPCGVMD